MEKDKRDLIEVLERRFSENMERHVGTQWADVEARLVARPESLHALSGMESTGGEPDVVGVDASTGELIFFDCSRESPAGRRSLCYDREGLDSRKEHKPVGSAVDAAAEMGVELLTEEQYLYLQSLGEFDLKTSSWLRTPADVRGHGGAIFGDRRFGRVFIYHNGAQSYYGSRGFRAALRV